MSRFSVKPSSMAMIETSRAAREKAVASRNRSIGRPHCLADLQLPLGQHTCRRRTSWEGKVLSPTSQDVSPSQPRSSSKQRPPSQQQQSLSQQRRSSMPAVGSSLRSEMVTVLPPVRCRTPSSLDALSNASTVTPYDSETSTPVSASSELPEIADICSSRSRSDIVDDLEAVPVLQATAEKAKIAWSRLKGRLKEDGAVGFAEACKSAAELDSEFVSVLAATPMQPVQPKGPRSGGGPRNAARSVVPSGGESCGTSFMQSIIRTQEWQDEVQDVSETLTKQVDDEARASDLDFAATVANLPDSMKARIVAVRAKQLVTEKSNAAYAAFGSKNESAYAVLEALDL